MNNIINNITHNSGTNKCSLCGNLNFGTCSECWTLCQICLREMNTLDCSRIELEGFDDADFCIQCSGNLFSFDNVVTHESVIKFSQTIRPFIHFLGMTNVLFLQGTTSCVVCNHRIPSQKTCCDTCRFSYFIKQINRILPKSHSLEIYSYMR